MCYDISFTVNIKQLTDYFPTLVTDEQIEIDFNKSVHIIGHEYGEHPIIFRNREDGELHLKLMEWGCIPFYVKDEKSFIKQRATMLNARSERVLADPSGYWHKIKNRRCLIPLSAFYEHREVKGIKNKIPYHISIKGQELFFLPGLYSVVELPDKETGELKKRWTFTILTTSANELMVQIHNAGTNKERMPLIIPNAMAEKWIQAELNDNDYKSIIDYEFPAHELAYKTVYSIRTLKERPDGLRKDDLYKWEGVEDLTERAQG
jgi:putative SOS response-associated peptidase YedK